MKKQDVQILEEIGDSAESLLVHLKDQLENLPEGSQSYNALKSSLNGMIKMTEDMLEVEAHELTYLPTFLLGFYYKALLGGDTFSGFDSWNLYCNLVKEQYQLIARNEWANDTNHIYRVGKMTEIVEVMVQKDRSILKLEEHRNASKGGPLTDEDNKKLERAMLGTDALYEALSDVAPDYAKKPGRPKDPK